MRPGTWRRNRGFLLLMGAVFLIFTAIAAALGVLAFTSAPGPVEKTVVVVLWMAAWIVAACSFAHDVRKGLS